MKRFVDDRTAGTSDEVWLVEHEPVFTNGRRAASDEAPIGGIDVVNSDRGGLTTWHGPGQFVAYPLLDTRRLGVGVRELVMRLEQTIIDTLARYRVQAGRRDGAPGVYVDNAKIAALGLRIRNGCSLHGLSINVDNDLAPYRHIDACGLGLAATRLCDHAAVGGVDEVAAVWLALFSREFGLSIQTSNAAVYAQSAPGRSSDFDPFADGVMAESPAY
ncbi:unnamed protein product, partial [Cyprideis torosa]